ncbi:MAG: ROK family protein [Anaerolineae bacterium]|nr:ROK family protein [Anaerolineae bacterium]
MPQSPYVIALDVGGSSVKSGLVDSAQEVLHAAKTPINSQGTADEVFGAFAAIIRTHLQQVPAEEVLGAGYAFPDPFDYQSGIVLIKDQPKFNQVYGMNVRDETRQRLGLPNFPMLFRNDAEAAIIGEAKYGAGKPYRKLIGITLGTGLGSALVENCQRVTEGEDIPPNGMLWHVPYLEGIADDYFSTRGLLKCFEDAHISVRNIAEASQRAESGEAVVQAVFAEFGAELGDFLSPYVDQFGAEAVVVLGGITGAMPHFEQTLHEAIGVPLHVGTRGMDAPLLGAAALLLPDH